MLLRNQRSRCRGGLAERAVGSGGDAAPALPPVPFKNTGMNEKKPHGLLLSQDSVVKSLLLAKRRK